MNTAANDRIPRHRLTLEEYHRMGEARVLGDESRVELIDGELVDMTPIGSRHAGAVSALNDALAVALHGRAIVAVQSPVTLGDRSEPQPDLAILRFRDDFYRNALPGTGDIHLLIEVADTSLSYDRGVKLPLYASHAIPEVWLIDLQAMRVDAYSRPSGAGYTECESYSGGVVSPRAFPDVAVRLGLLGFGPR